EVSSMGVVPEAATSALETGEAVAETALAQDNQVVSSLAEGGAIAQSPETPIQAPISEDTLAPSVSVVTERAPVPEARPQNVQAGELPVTEVTAPVSQIEEIRREAVSSEIPGEAPSPEPEADVIDFNQMKEAAARANEELVADIEDTQKNFGGKLTDAGLPETGSVDFRTMQKESDALGAELGAQIVDTQEKFESLLDKTEAHSQEILKNAQEVMAAASANIQRAQEDRDRSEEILRIEEEENDRRTQEERDRIEKSHSKEKEEIARKRSENEEKFSRIVEKNNPILERSHELINEYGSSARDQALTAESLEKTA
ncbi:hypothetical protein K0A96_02260, partial [Patescibacteria group bacterium]|nr:hypothetical protein [Patescibacteria group bacterium]